MKAIYCLLFACCIMLSSCIARKTSMPRPPAKAYMAANPPKIIQIGGFPITPKQATEYDTLLKSGKDTLGLLVNSYYVYNPFGIFKSNSKLNTGLLKNFSCKSRIIKTDIGDIEIKTLTLGSSKLMFSNNKTTPGKNYDIDKGEIYDLEIHFLNGVKIGMSINDFYKIFFESFPEELESKYKYFMLKSVNEISHIYSFEDGRLKSVKLNSFHYFNEAY